MNLNIPFDVEVKGRAASAFTVEQIDARLRVLRTSRTDDAAREEIAYLERLRARKFGDA
jgi:hypothetical protein